MLRIAASSQSRNLTQFGVPRACRRWKAPNQISSLSTVSHVYTRITSHARQAYLKSCSGHAGLSQRFYTTFIGDEENGLRLLEITSTSERDHYKSILSEAKSLHAAEASTFHSVLCFLPREEGKPLPKEAIIGWLRSEPQVSKRTRDLEIEPINFVENPFFSDFLHSVIAEAVTESWDYKITAAETKTGWMNIYDGRTLYPGIRRPVEDILGSVKLENGAMVKGSYERNPAHRLVSLDGVMKLEASIRDAFLAALRRL